MNNIKIRSMKNLFIWIQFIALICLCACTNNAELEDAIESQSNSMSVAERLTREVYAKQQMTRAWNSDNAFITTDSTFCLIEELEKEAIIQSIPYQTYTKEGRKGIVFYDSAGSDVVTGAEVVTVMDLVRLTPNSGWTFVSMSIIYQYNKATSSNFKVTNLFQELHISQMIYVDWRHSEGLISSSMSTNVEYTAGGIITYHEEDVPYPYEGHKWTWPYNGNGKVSIKLPITQ